MNSHIIEYQCQYTDQIRKKNKVWHDGKLKYFQINDRFQLFREEDNIQISSQFITNKKEVDFITDPENFDSIEHKIFSNYIVIILEKLNEYDREVKITLKHNNIPPSQTVSKFARDCEGKGSMGEVKIRKTLSRIMTSKVIPDTSSISGSSLALKMNKPFKKPRIVKSLKDTTVPKNSPNRPNIRAKVKTPTQNMHNIVHTNHSNKESKLSLNFDEVTTANNKVINQKLIAKPCSKEHKGNTFVQELPDELIESESNNQSKYLPTTLGSETRSMLTFESDSNTKTTSNVSTSSDNSDTNKKRVAFKTGRKRIRTVNHKPINL